jgi:hypothetical protein
MRCGWRLLERSDESFIVDPMLVAHLHLKTLHHHKQLAIPKVKLNISIFLCNASLIIISSIKMGSFANGSESISGRVGAYYCN